MFFNDESFTQAERNLAWDEASVELADRLALEANPSDEPRSETVLTGASHTHPAPSFEPFELLRIWKFDRPTVVMGRASRVQDEVFVDKCEHDSVPILRRSSGGSTIVAGPGCLMYSVLISYDLRPTWRSLDVAHAEVMTRVSNAVSSALNEINLTGDIALQGTCDLTWDDAKFSGNALRCKRKFMLYHGTILIDMPLDWVSIYLREPPRQPEYRLKRKHASFVRNLLNPSQNNQAFEQTLSAHLRRAWDAITPWDSFPYPDLLELEIDRWMAERYSKKEWHFER